MLSIAHTNDNETYVLVRGMSEQLCEALKCDIDTIVIGPFEVERTTSLIGALLHHNTPVKHIVSARSCMRHGLGCWWRGKHESNIAKMVSNESIDVGPDLFGVRSSEVGLDKKIVAAKGSENRCEMVVVDLNIELAREDGMTKPSDFRAILLYILVCDVVSE